MATQRLTVATFVGRAATGTIEIFDRWRRIPDAAEVDLFCQALREHGQALPIIYYGEWMDRWLMGDLVPGPGAVEGQRFQATCMLPEQAFAWADQCGRRYPEQEWLAARLREAASGWGVKDEPCLVVVLREVIDVSTLDEEVRASANELPSWLLPYAHRA